MLKVYQFVCLNQVFSAVHYPSIISSVSRRQNPYSFRWTSAGGDPPDRIIRRTCVLPTNYIIFHCSSVKWILSEIFPLHLPRASTMHNGFFSSNNTISYIKLIYHCSYDIVCNILYFECAILKFLFCLTFHQIKDFVWVD